MSLDLAFDDAQQTIADAIGQFCADRCSDDAVKAVENRFPDELWKELAELGVLALMTPEGEGGPLELVAALEPLGRAVFPGPLLATFFATQLLASDDRQAVASGASVASVGVPPLMPWSPVAQLFVTLGDGRAWKAEPAGPIVAVETLGGEPWGRCEFTRSDDLGCTDGARSVYDLALAAYLAAAGRRLVDDTAEHARTRKQFGRAIGEFQAVAHPLADCAIRLDVAQTLARSAAYHLDRGDSQAGNAAAAARVSASRAAVDTAYLCHQLFGAVGITLEGPVFHVSRRIRQLASQEPGEAASRDALLQRYGL